MSIQQDIEDIANAESGESVRSAIISAIQDLNQNGGNAQTLNNHTADDFTKKAEFDDFVDEEVGQIHLVLDAINKGTSLKVIDLGVKTIGPQGGVLAITVPASVKDRNLLTVDDFYADIVEIAAGSGENVHWTKTDSYDNVSCEYRYAYSALASAIKLHFYAKRASAIVVPDYNVHPYPGQVRENKVLQAESGEAWNYIDIMVPSGGKTEIEQTFNENGEFTPTDPNTTWGKVIIDVTAPTPELQTGSVSVGEATYHQEFNPTAPYVGFSKFTVDVNVPVPSIQTDRRVTMDTSGYVNPESGYDAMSTVYVTVPEQPAIETGKSVTYSSGGTYTVNPSSGYDAMDSVEVTVQAPVVQQSKSVTLSQSGTVTPDAGYDAMASVEVTVSGGGGANVMSKADWDLLTFAQKKQQGLTAIRNDSSELTGIWYDLSNSISEYLPYSSNIICDANINNFDATSNSWGDGTSPFIADDPDHNPILLQANSDGIGVDIYGVPDAQSGHPKVEHVHSDLGDVNTDYTAYLVVKYTEAYAYSAIIGTSYQESNGNCQYIIESGLNNVEAVCAGSQVFGNQHATGEYFVVAIRNNNKNMSYFKNGVKGTDRTAVNTGRYVTLATPYPNGQAYCTRITVAFAGVVSEAESDSVVLDNIAYLMNKFNIS